LSAEELRQLRAEARERRGELEELRRDLERQGVNVDQLRDVIGGIEAIENRPFKSREELERLQQDIIARLKDYEFGLRRRAQGAEQDKLYLTGSDQVPPNYRKIVEEYYRSLSAGRKKN
jgi:hypothetical protein